MTFPDGNLIAIVAWDKAFVMLYADGLDDPTPFMTVRSVCSCGWVHRREYDVSQGAPDIEGDATADGSEVAEHLATRH